MSAPAGFNPNDSLIQSVENVQIQSYSGGGMIGGADVDIEGLLDTVISDLAAEKPMFIKLKQGGAEQEFIQKGASNPITGSAASSASATAAPSASVPITTPSMAAAPALASTPTPIPLASDTSSASRPTTPPKSKYNPAPLIKVKESWFAAPRNDYKTCGKPISDTAPAGKPFANPYNVRILIDTLDKLNALKLKKHTEGALANLVKWDTAAEGRTPPVKIQVLDGDWGVITQQMTKRYGKMYAVLNMANEEKPGGGYEYGAPAQEENIFRRTSCHFSLDRETDMEEVKGEWRYTDAIQKQINGTTKECYLDTEFPRVCIKGPEVYSASKTTDEKKSYTDLVESDIFPFYELRSAATKVLKARGVKGTPGSPGYMPAKSAVLFQKDEMTKRIESQFQALQNKKIRHVILGAFGCGAFGNPPDQVADLYRIAIDTHKDHFDHIVFAIFTEYDGNKDNLIPFQLAFPTQEKTYNPGFHEPQSGAGCGRHALNNLFGYQYFTKGDHTIALKEDKLATIPIPLNSLCKLIANNLPKDTVGGATKELCKASEDYDITVIEGAVNAVGHNYDNIHKDKVVTSRGTSYEELESDSLLGYIINLGPKEVAKGTTVMNHWVALRKDTDTPGFIFKNSTNTRPGPTFDSLTKYLNDTSTGNWKSIIKVYNYTGFSKPLEKIKEIKAVTKEEEAKQDEMANAKEAANTLVKALDFTNKTKLHKKLKLAIDQATSPDDITQFTNLFKNLDQMKVDRIIEIPDPTTVDDKSAFIVTIGSIMDITPKTPDE